MIKMPNYFNILHLDKKRFLNYLKKVIWLNKQISDFNYDFYIYLFLKRIFLFDILLNIIVNVIRQLYDIAEITINRFTTYHLYFKEKSKIIEFIYIFFLFRLSSKLVLLLSIIYDYFVKIIAIYYLYYKEKLHTSFLTKNFDCSIESSLITIKKKFLIIFIYFSILSNLYIFCLVQRF